MRILLRDLSPGTDYHLQARVLDENVASEWSRKFTLETSIDTVPPAAPANPVIVMSGSEAALSWSPVTHNDDGTPIRDLSSYKVTVKSPSSSGSFVKDVGLATNMEFSLDTNRKAFGTPRGTLFFEVVAIDSIGNESSVSTSPTVSTPAPPNVTGLTATPEQSAISLKWNTVTSPIVTGYKVYMGTTAGFTPTTPVAEVSANIANVSTTLFGTDLYFKVVAVDLFSVTSLVPASAGPVRPISPFALDTQAPAVPSGLTATISNNIMKVSWSAVSDTDMKYYIVSYRQNGTTDWSTVSVPYDQTTTAINVVPGVNYNVRVLATDILSNMSNWSSVITTNSATVNTAPAVPTGLAVVAGKDDLQISWTENSEIDMKGNVGTYDVTVATNSGFTTGVLQYRTGATTLSINGLSTGTPYWVRVRATDNGTPPLSSAYSSAVTATTGQFPATPLSDGNVPASSPVATATGGFGYIHTSWTPIANNDIVTYEVHLGTTTSFTPSGSTKVGEVSGSTLVIENTAAGAALAYSTNYYVKIIAKDRDGAAAAGAASNAVQITKIAATDTTIQPVDIGAATQTDLNNKYNTALKNSVVEYAVSGSETVAPTTGWSSSTPTRTPGTFVWYRTVLTYGDNTTSTLSPALLTGNTGSTGSAGTPGTPASFITLTATTQVLTSPAAGGATSPTTSVITGTATNTTITAWTYSIDGAAFTATVPAGVVRSGNTVTITGSTMTAKTITVKMADAGTSADTMTVAKVFDGATGATGTPGTPGSTGAPGAAGADAYTVILSNEAQVFAGSTTAALAGSATSSVIAYKGSVQSVATIGTITGQVTGLTTAITNNGTNNATVTVTVTTALTALNGVLTIPVTVDGKTFTKTFSWSVSRQGVQGSQGIQGNPGADGVTTYTWLKYADTPTTGMSDSPTGKTYMGIATNKTVSTESSTYADYTWSLIKGADGSDGSPGVPGTPGADGVTTYTWVKYATSAAGAGLSDDPTGKTYIGLAFNKTTATESTTPGEYQWSLIQGPQGDTGNTGAPGTPAEMVYLTATTQVLTSPATGGATSPTTAVVTGASVNGTITVWQYSTNGAAFTNTLPAGVTRSGNVVTITGSTVTANTITVRMATASGVSDTLTVAKVSDGAQGATGNTGSPGAAGADAYTVILSNEAHSFAGSTTAALAGSTTSTVIAYKGSTQQTATVGTITGQVTGLTTSIASNGTTAPVITITVTTSLTTRNGTLTVPVTVDGKVFTKTIAWAVAYAGATGSTGAPGTPGSNGISVTSVTPYFQTVTKGAAAPAAPTVMTPPGPWSATEPSYTPNTELYRTDRVVYSNSTFSYSAVTKVAAYSGLEAVTADAQVKANAAKDAAISSATDLANGVESRTLSRGTDLVTNGTGSMGNNTNFSQFTLDKTDAPNGAAGSFDSVTPGVAATRTVDEFLPVDTNKRFMFSFQARQKGTTVGGYMYSGVIPYDAYKMQISPYHTMYQPGTLTTLASPVNPGDTTITIVTPSTPWYGSAGKNAGGSSHFRSIIWWDYTDEGGKLWGPETYSRNYSGTNYWADGAISGNVITLNAPYSGPVRPAGTQLSNGSSGGTYMYGGVSQSIIPKEWTGYSATITGVITGGAGPSFANGWPVGTAYARLMWLTDRASNGSSDAGSKHSVAAVSFSDASAANYAANNITETQITDYAITTPKIATDAINARTVIAGAIGTVALAAEAVDATKIKANSISAEKMAIGDTANMATINESYPDNANFGSYKHTIVGGWSTRDINTDNYLMFRPNTGPIPFKNGDRIRVSFEAYSTVAVTPALNMWTYGSPATTIQTIGSPVITTTAQTFDYEMTITTDTANKYTYTFGLFGVNGRNVFVRNVRAYVMNAGELIVDGTIHGNKMITNTLDANVIKTSTLTSTTITLGAGGIIKSATGGFQITNSGITIPAGTIDANILKANTSFITTLNVGAGGSIQSTGYTSGGTTGFSLSSSGLTIKGTNNTVDGGTIPTSTLDVNSIKTSSLTATTISLGANGNISVGVGGKITVDGSTGVVQSNNFSGTTTGWQLGYQGLVINQGAIDAKVLRTNSAIIGDLVIGQSANSVGSLKSFGYVANSTGFKLDKTGLEINSGSIAAEALRLQIGRNQMHPAYADFEYDESFYAGKIANFFAIPMVSSEQAKFGSKSLKIAWTGGSGASVMFAETDTSWNVRFDPSKPQIVSMWIYQPDAYALQMLVKVNRSSGGPLDIIGPSVSVGTGWQRIEFELTPPALATGDAVVMLRTAGASSGKSMYVDAIQFEERTGAAGSAASTYFPPSTTTIDGGAIRTGSIRSSALNSRSEPFWSVNMSGNAVFNRALIQEELIVGDPSDAAKFASIKSVNYQSGTAGWQISSTGLIEMNDGIFRGRVVSGDPNGQRAEQSVDGFKVWLIDPSRPEMEPWAATSLTTGNVSIGIMGSDGTKLAGITPEGVVTGVTSAYMKDIRIKGSPLLGQFGGEILPGWLDNLPRGIISLTEMSNSSTSGAVTNGGEALSIGTTARLKADRRYRIVAQSRFNVGVANGGVSVRIRTALKPSTATTSSPIIGLTAYNTASPTSNNSATTFAEAFYSPTVDEYRHFRMTFQGFNGGQPNRFGGSIYCEDVGPVTPAVTDNGESTGDSTVGYVTTWRATASRMYRHTGAYITTQEGNVGQWHWASPVAHEQAGILFAGNSTESTDSSEMNRTVSSVLNGATIIKVEVYLRNKTWYSNESGRVVLGSLGSTSLPTSKIIDASYDGGELAAGEGRWFEVTKTWFTNGTSQTNLGITVGDKDGTYASKGLVSGFFHGINDTDPPLLRITYSRPS